MKVKLYMMALATLIMTNLWISSSSICYVQAAQSEYNQYITQNNKLLEYLQAHGGSEDLFNQADGLLNEEYQLIKSKLASAEFDDLKKLEFQWLDERDSKANNASNYWQSMTQSTIERNQWLLDNYDYCFSREGDEEETQSVEVVEMPKEEKSDNNSNHPELIAYKNYLADEDWTGYAGCEEIKMAVFDLNQDNVWEMGLFFKGDGWADYTTGILSYGNGEMIADIVHATENANMGFPLEGINEAEGRYVLGRTKGKNIQTFYQLNGDGSSEELGIFCLAYYDNFTESEKEEYHSLNEGMLTVNYVDINPSNIDTYLSGDGQSTGTGESLDYSW